MSILGVLLVPMPMPKEFGWFYWRVVRAAWASARAWPSLGILSAGIAAGQVLFLPLAAWHAVKCGWRSALLPWKPA